MSNPDARYMLLLFFSHTFLADEQIQQRDHLPVYSVTNVKPSEQRRHSRLPCS
jgi:hypothetical protein